MGRTKLSFAETISKTQVLATALKANSTQLEKRGIDNSFITELEKLRNESITLNDEQEKLKADLKLKTEALLEKINLLEKKYAEAKKIIKIDFAQSQWVEFGIEDKR
ncbi:hypothetical protein [Riemerella columbipharyngis]|uniref:Membrane-binding protein n=1 Tax=Riemerella columbipharyngis TaxID=1071918 RepID=A0A1G7BKY0_9FLAO|nr:hypothetical protein [Riemerella columbipharyngis]SDE27390.1 hypothetical protein SAMN05421544_10624 [Riemerella columbipharyngis]